MQMVSASAFWPVVHFQYTGCPFSYRREWIRATRSAISVIGHLLRQVDMSAEAKFYVLVFIEEDDDALGIGTTRFFRLCRLDGGGGGVSLKPLWSLFIKRRRVLECFCERQQFCLFI